MAINREVAINRDAIGHYITSDLSSGCNNEVAALLSDHYTEVSLKCTHNYNIYRQFSSVGKHTHTHMIVLCLPECESAQGIKW